MNTIKKTYNKYPTSLKMLYKQNAFNKSLFKSIPRSTRQYWKDFGSENLFEHNNFQINNSENALLVKSLREIQELKKIIRALVYLIVVYKKLLFQFKLKRENILPTQKYIALCLSYFEENFSKPNFFKWLPFSSNQWASWNSSKGCKISLLSLCRLKHPQQLTTTEINIIDKNCRNDEYKYWPLVSIYYKLLRDKLLFCSRSTFYKYCRLLSITNCKKHKHKNYKPLIAKAAKQILHLDVTIYSLQNGTKVYLHVLRDNFSKAILGCKAAANCCSKNSKGLLEEVLVKYNLMNNEGLLITDDGSENKGELQTLVNKPGMLWKKLVAQIDIVQSNSMVEAANKILKYQFLFHKVFDSLEQLQFALPLILAEYNNMPNASLFGLTPSEVIAGAIPNKNLYSVEIANSKKLRLFANQKIICNNTC